MSGLAAWRVGLCVAIACVWLPTAGGQQPAGLPPEWEVKDNLSALAKQIDGLKPLLESVKPDQWTAHGAPEAYIAQWKSLVEEIGYVGRTSGELSADPERLSTALEMYFRVQSLDQMAESLNEGIRKYQSPELANLIRERLSGTSAAREKLRQYIVLLAPIQEGQFKVMAEEAQRCRGTLSRQAPARGGSAPRTEKK
jgi:hypothetical protein